MVAYQVRVYKKYNLNSIYQLHNYDLRENRCIETDRLKKTILPFLLITSGATRKQLKKRNF